MDRVQKLLSNYGYCSRRKAEKLIEEKRVKVNGKVIILGDKATDEDEISVDNKAVKKQKTIYLMLHKSVGCVTALTDPKYPTVMKYIDVKERVFPIGRLDYNTSGILLFTNDGTFANKIMHPRYEIKKTYLASLYTKIADNRVSQIEKGIMLDDGRTSPAKVKKINHNLIEITIHEGKNRIIRRMLTKLEMKVKSLKRIKIGNLTLGDLKKNKCKYLSERERDLIFS
ncbi:rRNA pseudouridine synthase [Candidatus Woesearchaeota archaeon]|nr:rRNA pseudouridine synthase [Candidatus Woesearchaeota archaeon]